MSEIDWFMAGGNILPMGDRWPYSIIAKLVFGSCLNVEYIDMFKISYRNTLISPQTVDSLSESLISMKYLQS